MAYQYTYISGKELIARIATGFVIDNSQWIYAAPLWLADGLAQLKIIQSFQYVAVEGAVSGYRCELPCNIALLIAVEHEGRRLRRLGKFNHMDATQLAAKGYNTEEGYELVGDGWITTSFSEGTILFHCKIPPVELDTVTNSYVPKIPNDPYVIEAIRWYVMLQLLYMGFKHPVFDLNSNNEFTNPGIQWEKNKKRARNSVNVIDADTMEQISSIVRKFIQNYNSYTDVMFSNSNAGNGGGELTLMESVTNTYSTTTLIENTLAVNKYIRQITNEDTVLILADVHGLGVNVIPVLFELVGGTYTKVLTEFIVDLSGNVTWNGSSVVANGYIILM